MTDERKPPPGETPLAGEEAIPPALMEFVKALARRRARIDFEEEQQAARQAKQETEPK